MEIARFFDAALQKGASDIMLAAGTPPAVRLNGVVVPFDLPPLTSEETAQLVYSVLSQEQIGRFERDLELDFSIQFQSKARFRGNAYKQKGSVAAVFRLIASAISSLAELNLPPVLEEICMQAQGLLLFTGPTGHGKSSTQAALLDMVNQRRRCHIVTVEDPIEFLHTSKKSIVDQREVGDDTRSFASALKHVLRQAPDVILIGELRDLESISVGLTAAETGHLVLATLHTNSAIQAVDRMIDVFPPAPAEPDSHTVELLPAGHHRPAAIAARRWQGPHSRRGNPEKRAGHRQLNQRRQNPTDRLHAGNTQQGRHADDGCRAKGPLPAGRHHA
jgi:twitching motility protein PilT